MLKVKTARSLPASWTGRREELSVNSEKPADVPAMAALVFMVTPLRNRSCKALAPSTHPTNESSPIALTTQPQASETNLMNLTHPGRRGSILTDRFTAADNPHAPEVLGEILSLQPE